MRDRGRSGVRGTGRSGVRDREKQEECNENVNVCSPIEVMCILTLLHVAAAIATPLAPSGVKRVVSVPVALLHTFTSPSSPHTASLAPSSLNTTRSFASRTLFSIPCLLRITRGLPLAHAFCACFEFKRLPVKICTCVNKNQCQKRYTCIV